MRGSLPRKVSSLPNVQTQKGNNAREHNQTE